MPVRLVRQHNLGQVGVCSARPNPQHSPHNLLLVVALALLDLPAPLPERGLVHLASNNNNHSHSSSSSSRPGPRLVRLVKLNHSHRVASVLAASVPHNSSSSLNSKPAASSARVILLSVKSPPPADSVRVSRFKLVLTIDTSKAPQPQVLALSVPELEPLVRRSHRQRLPLVLPNSRRLAHLALEDSVPVSLKTRLIPLTLTPFFLAANKTIFGQPGTGTFGTTTTGTGTGIFGQQPQQQQPAQPTTGLFGTTTTGTTGTGLFGQQQQPQQTTGREYTNAFLSDCISLPQVFGATQPQQQQQQQTSGLFGGQTTGLFGAAQQNQPAQQNPLGGGIFGQKTATPSTGLFGSTTASTTPAQAGTLFAGGTLGQPQNQQTNTGFGGSLFGKPATTNGTAQPSTFGGSTLFGSTNQTPFTNGTAQGTLTPTIDQPVNTNIPIFSLLPSGPQLNSLDASLGKKKAEFFVDVPTRSSIPVVSRGTTPVNSKIRGAGRGFTSSTYMGASTNNLGSSLSFWSSKSNALSLNKSSTQRGNLTTDTFSSPSFGSGNRDSVKKLVMDKKVDLFDWAPKSADVTFNPALSVAAREKEAVNGPLGATRNTPTTPTINPPSRIHARTPNRFTAQSTTDASDEQSGELREGEYWSEPPMATLSSWGHNELIAIEKLVVGRVGYGKITFLDPVDLTGSGSVKQLFGDLVRFEDKECSVYPDLDNVDKPPPGSGLNVRAMVELDGCWPVDKATREPIKDENHPQMVKHLKRLRGMKDTKFESFDMKDGKWTFTVDHF